MADIFPFSRGRCVQTESIGPVTKSVTKATRRRLLVHPIAPGALYARTACSLNNTWTGVRMIDNEVEYRPRKFRFKSTSFCAWGSKPDIPEFKA
jgi:hypothetical protein